MRDLDRSFFSRKIPTTAARVADNKHLARLRTDLERSGTLLQAKRLRAVQPDPDHERRANGGRCLVLETRVKHDGQFVERRPNLGELLLASSRKLTR